MMRLNNVTRDLNEKERDYETIRAELTTREKELIAIHGECEALKVAKHQMESCVSYRLFVTSFPAVRKI